MPLRLLLPLLAAAGLAACSSADPRSAGRDATGIAPWTGELPISAPWLREQLPAGALAYQRIPHPLALLALPKGNAFDTALGSEANIRNLVRIQEGLSRNLGIELPPARLLEPYVSLELSYESNPAEILFGSAGFVAAAAGVAAAIAVPQIRAHDDDDTVADASASAGTEIGVVAEPALLVRPE